MSLKLSVSGPVEGDIMVFGAAPCSAGRKKWRHGAFLGLLPPPVGGESDITELYVARYGEPEPGQRVFIRTRQQRDGWEGHPRDVSDVVVAKPTAAGVEIPKPEARNPKEIRKPKPEVGLVGTGGESAMHKGAIRYMRRSITVAIPSKHGNGMRSAEREMRSADWR